MVTTKTLKEFRDALEGERGDLDAWLEVNNEAEVREHIKALVSEELKRG